VLLPHQRSKLARGAEDKEHAMSEKPHSAIAVIGIDIGKNSFHVVGLDDRGAIVLRQKWSRGQVEARFANIPPCLIGMEDCVGAHHLSRKLQGAWPRRPADAGEVRAAVFKGTEERLPRRGGAARYSA
jgi:transposase